MTTEGRLNIINLHGRFASGHCVSHLSSRLIVVQVHLASSVAFDLPHIQKFSGESYAKIDINWTASPLPWLKMAKELKDYRISTWMSMLRKPHLILISILVPMNLITTTYWDISTGTCSSDRINNPSIGDRVCERCFFRTCNKRTKICNEFNAKKWKFIIGRVGCGETSAIINEVFQTIFQLFVSTIFAILEDVIMAQMSLSCAIIHSTLSIIVLCQSFFSNNRQCSAAAGNAGTIEVIDRIDESQNRVLCYQQTINNGRCCSNFTPVKITKPRDDLRASD